MELEEIRAVEQRLADNGISFEDIDASTRHIRSQFKQGEELFKKMHKSLNELIENSGLHTAEIPSAFLDSITLEEVDPVLEVLDGVIIQLTERRDRRNRAALHDRVMAGKATPEDIEAILGGVR